MSGAKELPIPNAVTTAKRAIEVARVWVADGNEHVALATELWADPATWGIVLVDLARHVARAYEQTGGPDAASALARIRSGFDAEWETPTEEPTGNVL